MDSPLGEPRYNLWYWSMLRKEWARMKTVSNMTWEAMLDEIAIRSRVGRRGRYRVTHSGRRATNPND